MDSCHFLVAGIHVQIQELGHPVVNIVDRYLAYEPAAGSGMQRG